MSQPVHTSSESPRSNAEWAEAIVKWSRYEYVAVYDYPTTGNSEAIMGIYKGDMVQISRRYRRADWCLCRIGHALGWVFLDDVQFLVRGAKPMRRKRRTQQMPAPTYNDSNEIETVVPMLDRTEIDLNMEMRTEIHEKISQPIQSDPNDVETSPMPSYNEIIEDELDMDTRPAQREPILRPETGEPAPVAEKAKTGKKSLINRMINFFQR